MRKLSSIGFVGAFLAGCASSPPPAPAPSVPKFSAPGYWRAVDQVVLVTDASGTIYNNGNFPQAKSTSQAIVAGLPDGNVQTPFEGTYNAGFSVIGRADLTIVGAGASSTTVARNCMIWLVVGVW